MQLLVLQARMRQALEYLYRLRGLQSKADIADFELKCIANGEKLVTLQSEMMKVIEHINRFLEANNASHNVISLQAAESARTPASGTLVAWRYGKKKTLQRGTTVTKRNSVFKNTPRVISINQYTWEY